MSRVRGGQIQYDCAIDYGNKLKRRIRYSLAVVREVTAGRARGVVERMAAEVIMSDPGKLAAFARVLRRVENQPLETGAKSVLVCAAPKSASTFLVQAMAAAFDLAIASYSHVRVDAHGNETLLDQELSYSSILFRKFAIGHSISQLHVTASKRNLEIIRNLGVKCIVTQRNLFDTAVSLRDNFVNTTSADSVLKTNNLYAPGHGVFFRMPPFNERRKARLGSEAEQYDFIIDYLMPWYFQFYGTWMWAERQGDVSIVRIDFNDLTTDPKAVLKQLSGFIGIDIDLMAIDEQIGKIRSNKRTSNFNIGECGRGKKLLSVSQQNRVVEIGCRYMKYEDFEHLL